MPAFVHAWICACEYACLCLLTCMCAFAFAIDCQRGVCVHVHMRTCLLLFIRACVHACLCECLCPCLRTCMRICACVQPFMLAWACAYVCVSMYTLFVLFQKRCASVCCVARPLTVSVSVSERSLSLCLSLSACPSLCRHRRL